MHERKGRESGFTSNMMGLLTRAMPRPAIAPPLAATVVATQIEKTNPTTLSVEQTEQERERERRNES